MKHFAVAAVFMLSSVSSFPQLQLASLENPTLVLKQMTQRYKLDAEQQSEIKPILESEAQDAQNLASLPPSQREMKMKEIRALSNHEIDAVLHEPQRRLFDRDQK
jgi:hypothetical protein